jgi:uncharacterized membrane protein YphA (DoxX/SURF4 family)
MKIAVWISRVFVGILFIFSGLIKLNDPLGFSYKLEDYFAPDVLNLMVFEPYALAIALIVVILEVLLGVALLIGFKPKATIWLLLLMIVFFTFLTFYSAYFEKVTDCGCFGDAIPLTPWESFTKDVILTLLILALAIGQKYVRPIVNHPRLLGGVMFLSLLGSVFFGYHVLNHLPVKDFRPYAIGKSIPEGMKTAEELGLEGPEYQTVFTMRHRTTGELVEITNVTYSAEKWWEKSDYELLSDLTKFKKVSDGYEPPIHDFIVNYEGSDITYDVLQKPAVFLVIAAKLHKASIPGFEKVSAFANDAQKAGFEVLGLTSASGQEAEEFRHRVQAAYPFAEMDQTTLKTIVRSNPGIVLLKKGVVINKWHYNDLPNFSEVQKKHLLN